MFIHARDIAVAHIEDRTFFNSVSVSNHSQEIARDTRAVQAVLMSCMITVTGTGNALVILGFVTNKKLRTPSNYFLLNLAISDFFTGIFSLPLYLNNFIINEEWVLGKAVCKLWLTINYTLCQCTIYNIVLISCDRFLAVTKAVKYRDQQNKIKPAFLKMAVVWILAFLNFGPAILFWEYVVGYSLVPNGECNPEFYYSGNYLLYSSIFDFFTPMTAIAFFNLSIYFNIRRRTKDKVEKNATDSHDNGIFVIQSTNGMDLSSTTRTHCASPSCTSKKRDSNPCSSEAKLLRAVVSDYCSEQLSLGGTGILVSLAKARPSYTLKKLGLGRLNSLEKKWLLEETVLRSSDRF
ncbi:histamine H3 receptor-like [Spea bombifrons]|uniref:histamine H3 receptor-like n=1 Tax=Spea bombifrons TaxID=233779 RepID=UPI002349DC39|nr:histamine H3 receptor-like [Spea bombifrons]